jgi:hypothetical protein
VRAEDHQPDLLRLLRRQLVLRLLPLIVRFDLRAEGG